MTKKENRIIVQKAVIRDEQNHRIRFAANNEVSEVLKNLHTTLNGLDNDAVELHRTKYGSNKVTHEKKKEYCQAIS